jgi:hypothetical protein
VKADFEKGFVARLEQRVQQGFFYGGFVAPSPLDGRVHFHVFLGAEIPLPRDHVIGALRLKNTRVTRYDPSRGAAFYVADHYLAADEDEVEWLISKRQIPNLGGVNPLLVAGR